ncbi:oxidoreductase [Collimonas pratensis]|uniref:oxidoreductase n=1 Tax=Collimonas pratensis TaxID=279113 RepID=UPI00143CD4F1|nr:oxidoreductase [Collimonas pratensis]NKI68967.1 oxidoreductase [Collimonas pratensis]
MPAQPNSEGYYGQQDVTANTSEYNALTFLVSQILAGKNTATLVQIKAVTNSGGVSPVGFVDVLPLVNQLDGNNNATPHGVVHNLPYFRLQGGTDAVIIDPKIGDIGVAVFADRDISAVCTAKAAANPGSLRRNDMADGMYFGGMLNGVPVQYIQFAASGINIVSPTKITLTAPLVEIDASTSFTVNSPQSNFSGMVIIQGLLSWLAGMTGSTTSGVAATITGIINFIGSVTSNGKAIDSTHTHHENGAGSNTNPPN